MPDKYWLVLVSYNIEQQDYTNHVIMVHEPESVVRSKMNDLIKVYKKAGYKLYGDEDTAILANKIEEVTFYILKVVHEWPR